jgi:sporulation protein YlmC with PRC-barrel domain
MELGCIEEKEVFTKDGRKIGVLVGAKVDTDDWTVHSIMIDVTKEMVMELGLKKSMLKSPKTSISTRHVSLAGDIIQLNVTLKELKDLV